MKDGVVGERFDLLALNETPMDDSLESWKRAADSAAAVHQIRNRLQSIIIETALLKRGGPTVDPSSLARIGALAQDGASYLELFGELFPCPCLDGTASFGQITEVCEESDVEVEAALLKQDVAIRPEALQEILHGLLAAAIPFRGYRAIRLSLGPSLGGRLELQVELRAEGTPGKSGPVTPWMTTQQMARDAGGSLELHSGEPPLVKLHLPRSG